MRQIGLALALGAGLLLAGAPAHAQWRYMDTKGTSRVSQYKVDVPKVHRDEAVWIGPVGIGKPGLSEAQRQARQREDAYRRLGEAQQQRLAPFPR
jgi:hypothetical protein